MPNLVIDPTHYAHAANSMDEVAHSTDAALSAVSTQLGGSGGMGGSDNAGVEWSNSYDEGARAALNAAASAVGAAGSVALRLHATGQNHAHADASSTIGGAGDSTLPRPPRPPATTSPSAPSAAGGSGSGPTGWSLVEGLVGYVWPNGHQDRLHAADAAWKAAAARLHEAAGPTGSAAAAAAEQRSPESAAAARACTETGDHLHELASVFTEIGSSCAEYAAHLDTAHHEIISELESLLAQTVAIEAVSFLTGIFTAGAGELAGQAVEAGRLALAAAKIRCIIEALIAAARTVAASVGRVASRAGEVLSKLRPIESATVKRATATASDDVAKLGPAGSIRTVNPGGGKTNCINCVATTDKMLDGEKVSAALGPAQHPSVLEDLFNSKFYQVSGKEAMDGIMQGAGDGARGVVYGGRLDDVGHVFNAVNQNGIVRFLDGQTGREASFEGFDHFFFMRYR